MGNTSLDQITPGPGEYPVHEIVHVGQKRSFLGGKIQTDFTLKDDGIPGPGQYQAQTTKHITGFKMMPKTEPKKKKKVERTLVGPQRYNPKYPAHVQKGTKFGAGLREPMKKKEVDFPAPNAHNIESEF
jgi:hypothetical protein